MPGPIKRARKRKKGSGILPALIVVCVVVVVVLSFSLINSMKEDTQKVSNSGTENLYFSADASSTTAPLVLQERATKEPSVTVQPTQAPIEEPAKEQHETVQETPHNRLAPTPLPGEGYGSVYDKAMRTQNDAPMIAILITGCSKPMRMNDLVNIGSKYNAKFTLFPVGNALLTNGMTNAFKMTVQQLGWEIEGCSFSHKKEFQSSSGELELEMWKQQIAVSYALGADYREHFYLPYSNNGTSDLRTHYYAQQLGYIGICGYTYSYINNYNEGALAATLENGNIYEFDMTDKAWGVLQSFMEAANAKGYKMVTMNELFGLERNAISNTLTIDVQELPELPEFKGGYYDLKLNDHCYAVVALQARLIELNYLTEESHMEINENGTVRTVVEKPQADGIYGSATSIAVSEFQSRVGLPATGNADVATQEAIFAINAPLGG